MPFVLSKNKTITNHRGAICTMLSMNIAERFRLFWCRQCVLRTLTVYKAGRGNGKNGRQLNKYINK